MSARTRRAGKPVPGPPSTPPSAVPWGILGILFGLGVLLYVQTVAYDYALDDKIVITHNRFTQEGLAGIPRLLTTDFLVGFLGEGKEIVAGSRYRPGSLVLFAVEWAVFGRSPGVSHLVNALLYGLTGALLYLVLAGLRRAPPGAGLWSVPAVAAALFLVHPVHTEVVANIKGRDEILSLLGGLAALLFTLRYFERRRGSDALLAAAVYLVGVFSKETAFGFLVLVPVALWCFRKGRPRPILTAMVPMGIAAAVYLAARFAVIGGAGGASAVELMNDPFLGVGAADRLATVVYTLGLYLKLLVVPYPLTHDYYPYHIAIVGWTNAVALGSLIVHAGLLALLVVGLRRRHWSAFAIAVYLVLLLPVSNLLFPVGTFMNERFLYAPSVGAALAAAIALVEGAARWAGRARVFQAGTLLLAVLFAGLSVTRNRAWSDDATLALTDVRTSSGSAKANMAAGAALIERGIPLPPGPERTADLERAEGYLRTAIRIHPTYLQALDLLGTARFHLGSLDSSYVAYHRCLAAGGGLVASVGCLANLEALGDQARAQGRPDLAVTCYQEALAVRETGALRAKLGQLYGRELGDIERAITELRRARELDPGNPAILMDLGVAFASSGRLSEAVEVLEVARTRDPDNAAILNNLAGVYDALGQTGRAQEIRARMGRAP